MTVKVHEPVLGRTAKPTDACIDHGSEVAHLNIQGLRKSQFAPA